MNKNFYRIVFNKARGMLMVVPDIAASLQSVSSPAGTGHIHHRLCRLRPLQFSLWLALGCVAFPTQAAIVADKGAPGKQQPTVINSANGTPQVNIQTPGAGGVSRNKFTQFDVDSRGVILNNSHKNVASGIGGMVTANPWLARGEAKVILNEVNSRHASQLNGMVEVAGKKAQVVIANPAGITCDGCGFINANRTTLTTGQVKLNNGQITGYEVGGGTVTVQGRGMDSSRQDSTDIIARAVKINAGVWANSLKVTTGSNTVDAENQTAIINGALNSGERPQFALDVSQLGGMYANKIRLRGTESGVGVRNAGTLGAAAGDVVLNADGSITNSGIINAKNDVQLASKAAVTNQGIIYGQVNSKVTASGALNNQGTIAAAGHTTVSADTISGDSGSTFAAGMQSNGQLTGTGDLTLNSRGALRAKGTNLATATLTTLGSRIDLGGSQNQANEITLSAGKIDVNGSQSQAKNITFTASEGDIHTANATITAGNFQASTKGMLNNRGGKISADKLSLTAAQLTNQRGLLQQTGQQDLILSHANGIDNQSGVIASNGKNLTLNVTKLNNQQGTLLHAGSDKLTLNVKGGLNNQGGNIQTAADLSLNSGVVDNRQGKLLAKNIQLDTAGQALFNQGGNIGASDSMKLNGGMLNNQQGTLVAKNMQLNTGKQTVNNQQGTIATGGKLEIGSGSVINDSGLIQAGADINLQLKGGALSNRNSDEKGGILSQGQLDISSGALDNQQGRIIAKDIGLNTGTEQINNTRGMLVASNGMHLNSGELTNDAGLIQAAGSLSVDVQGGMLRNRNGGEIGSQQQLTVRSGMLDNQQGSLMAKNIQVETGKQTINNQHGTIGAAENIAINSGGLINDGGLMQAGSSLNLKLNGGMLSNRNSGKEGGILSQGQLTLESGELNNENGFIAGSGDTLIHSGFLNNSGGTLASDAGLTLTSNGINNQNGLLQSGKTLQVDTQGASLGNINGEINAGDRLLLNSGELVNRDGRIISRNDTQIQTGGKVTNNERGTLVSGGNVRIDSGEINNRFGQIQIAGDAWMNALNATLNNHAGLIRIGKNLTIDSGQVINSATAVQNSGIEANGVTLNSATFDNSDGKLLANSVLDLNIGTQLNNTRGLISSGALFNLNGGSSLAITNTTGTLIGGDSLNIQARSLSGDGDVLSQKDMALNLQTAFVNQGQVIANGDMNFTLRQGLINESLIKAGGTLTLTTPTLENRESGEINAGENHLLVADTLTNRGLIDGGLTHIASNVLNNIGSGRIYGDHIAIATDTLNNLAENATSATIAARDRLDIGAGTINNRDRGLIYSGGDMAIGGTLNAQWQATGWAGVLNNHSSTLESAGNMTLNIGKINNINDHLVVEDVVVEQSHHHEAVLKGSTDRFNWDDIDLSKKDKYDVHIAQMPDGTKGKTFYEYNYDRTVTETQVKESEAGQIIAGGNLTLNSDEVNNKDSRVVAGGLLDGNIKTLNNIATTGTRVTEDMGNQVRWYSKKSSNGRGGTKTSQGKKKSAYQPDVVTQTIDLKTMAWEGNAQLNGSGTTINGRDTSGVNTGITAIGKVETASGSHNTGLADLNTDIALRPVVAAPGTRVEVGSGPDSIVRMSPPVLNLPANSLFKVNPSANVSWLIETDPRFTNNQTWLGSDYMQNQFFPGGDSVLKRLGDGFYEQRLIREQVVNLTGNRYLGGYDDDQTQFKGLMDAGVAFGKAHGLMPGVALSPSQMALLTSDMVWLVAQDIRLADGSVQKVLVPQLYARVKTGDLAGDGALLTGNNVRLNVNQDLTNSGSIRGRDVTQITAENLTNSGFIGGRDVSLNARRDLNNLGGILQADDSLVAKAGRDMNIISTVGGNDANSWIDRPAGIFVENAQGVLGLQALNNVNVMGGFISNAGEGSRTQIVAGNDLNLNTVTTTHSESGRWGKGTDRTLNTRTEVGSQIDGGGEVQLSAGRDVNARAATVNAQNNLSVTAGRDINVTSGESSYQLTENSRQTSGGLLSKKTTTTHDAVSVTQSVGSRFDGESVTMQAGRDLQVAGSSVVGEQDVRLSAGRDLTLTTANESRQETHQRTETKRGLSGTGGVGATYGKSKLKTTDTGSQQTSAGSMVGSTQGNVSLSAGNNLTVKGAGLIAGRDMSLTGREVNVLAADNRSVQTHTVEQSNSGLTLALSGAAGSAISQAVASAKAAGGRSDGRLAALDGMKAALNGVQSYQAMELAQVNGSGGGLVGANVSWGRQSSKSTQTTTRSDSQGSGLSAGNNLTVRATGGDIRVQGSGLSAGGNMQLSATRDVILSSAQNSREMSGKNESHGSSFGVGMTLGGAVSGSGSVNQSRGRESGSGLTHTETTLNAGRQVTISSGRDTALTGAQVSGNQVTLSVGRNLTLTSEQDRDNYDSKQTGSSTGVSSGLQASLNGTRDKMHSEYASVTEQTGIFAGSGGFDVKVGSHTQLNGAVIGSTADGWLNKVDTGTLGFSDIRNSADYSVEHQGGGLSTGGDTGGQFVGNMANGLLVGASHGERTQSTTKSAVSDGLLVVRDEERQKQNVAELSRDVANANPGLDVIFDKEREQKRLEVVQGLGELGSQVSDVIRTQGDIAGEKAKRDPEALAKARAELEKEGKDFNDREVAERAYNTAMKSYGTGSSLQQGVQAATAALQGLAGGDIAKAVAGGSAPYIAGIIGSQVKDDKAKVIAHAVVNAALAAAAGKSAAAGAAGASVAELTGMLSKWVLGKEPEQLSEEEKQMISSLATLAGGLAGGLTGGSTADGVDAAQAGKTTVENNSLGDIAQAQSEGKTLEQKAQEHVEAENESYKQQNCAGMSAEACSVKMYTERREALKDAASFGVDFVPVVGDIKSFAEAQSALDYLAAAIGIIPGAGDAAGKVIKAAETALKKGDVAKASKLINKASNDVISVNYFGQERKYWSAEPVNINGNKVYQRNDLFDPNAIDSRGRTNIQRMEKGLAPLDSNGQSVNLHHMLQKQDGPIAEVTQSFHKDNHSVIHINDNSIPSGIDRNAFNKWRSDYWKQRASDFKG